MPHLENPEELAEDIANQLGCIEHVEERKKNRVMGDVVHILPLIW